MEECISGLRTRSSSSSQHLLRCLFLSRWNGSVSSTLHYSRICGCPRIQRRHFNMASATSCLVTGSRVVIQGSEMLLQGVHELTHLPWWAVIFLSTAILRTLITLPLAVHQNKVIARMELLQPTVKEYGEAIKHRVVGRCRREGLPVEEANRRYKKEVRKMAKELYAQEGCHPLKIALLPWVQLPLWIVLSLSLRNLSGAFPGAELHTAAMLSLSAEGVLWFPDLTLPDPLYLLPALLASSNLINIEIHALKRKNPTTVQRVTTNLFRMLTVGMGVVSSQLPAAMSLYWAASSSYGLLQNVLLKLPRMRRALRIPRTPSESRTPFRDLSESFEEKARQFLAKQK